MLPLNGLQGPSKKLGLTLTGVRSSILALGATSSGFQEPTCPSLPEISGPLAQCPPTPAREQPWGEGQRSYPMPVRLGNLRCGDTAGGAFCRDTRVSPSVPLPMALLQSPRQEKQERRDQERRERNGRGLRLSLWQVRVWVFVF